MKVKYADRSNWRKVKERDFHSSRIEDNHFKGTVAAITLKEVKPKGYINYENRSYCIADNGYMWVQHFPDEESYTVTCMMNEEGEVIQWYIDICYNHGMREDGVQWYKDLYLDMVVLPTGEYYVLDEDELEDALKDKEITLSQYNHAWATLRHLIGVYERNQFHLLTYGPRYAKEILMKGR